MPLLFAFHRLRKTRSWNYHDQSVLVCCFHHILKKADLNSVGATGHIGGAVLDLISSSYSETLAVKVLVRDQQKAAKLKAQYRQITTVIGTLDDLDLLETESRDADIVISEIP